MSIKKICTQCGAEYGPEQKFCPNDGSPLRAESSDDPLIGRIIADRYHVTSLIGEGGMGRVYVAEHVRMGRKSALKVMSPTLAATADAITRFNREAANASRINHPNVAAIYDFGETPDGLLYLAMEFVEGESLHALVQRDGPLPIARAAQIIKGATDALSAAHHLGIIHRDLKPDNIMLARQIDGSDWVKVVDFGIAKSVATPGEGGGQTVTTAGVSLGTPEYMSPEQLAGEKLDQRTDIYSLGLVLFNMLTGDLPYPKLTSKETLVRRLTSRPASLTAVRPGIAWPAPLQAALDRALDPEPDRRYASVADFGRAVVEAAAGTPLDDPERTVRVAVPVRPTPALAATPDKRSPASVKPAGPGRTRVLPANQPKPASRGLWIAAAVVLVLGGGYTVLNAWQRRTPVSTAVTARDTVGSANGAVDTASPPPNTAPAPPVAKIITPQVTHLAAHHVAQPPRVAAATTSRPPAAARDTLPAAPAESLTQTRDPNAAASVVNSADRAGINRALKEIRSHMQAAGRYVSNGRANLANIELREAQGEVKTLRDIMPTGRMPFPVAQQLRGMAQQAMTACSNTANGDAAATQRCHQFDLRLGRGMRGRGQPNP